MGWSRGSELMSTVIGTLVENVEDADVRAEIYRNIIPAFEDLDCDTLDECFDDDDVFKSIYCELNPEFFEDEDDNEEELWDGED